MRRCGCVCGRHCCGAAVNANIKHWLWRCAAWLHRVDFAWILPWIARLPMGLAYALARYRGQINAWTGRDWRSMGLGFRHIYRASLTGYAQLPINSSEAQHHQWRSERFVAEARDEFEAQWIALGRVQELECIFSTPDALQSCKSRSRGLVLLTPHFESFFLGVGFLGRSGGVVNLMSSAVTKDPRVNAAVQRHFEKKYRGLEQYLNGGCVVDMEDGLRPFYAMLQRHETLVLLGDAPVLPQGVSMEVDFLGGMRALAGGGLRMAQRTGSDIGGFVCFPTGTGRYFMDWCEPGPADDPATVARVYDFFSMHILRNPGGWWASDLLPAMPIKGQV